jgi:hypothetical protein
MGYWYPSSKVNAPSGISGGNSACEKNEFHEHLAKSAAAHSGGVGAIVVAATLDINADTHRRFPRFHPRAEGRRDPLTFLLSSPARRHRSAD